jgi:hypothetical protein
MHVLVVILELGVFPIRFAFDVFGPPPADVCDRFKNLPRRGGDSEGRREILCFHGAQGF